MNERPLANWSTGNSLPPDDSLLHKYLPRTKDSLIDLSLNQPHLHLPAALPCALLTSLKAFVGAFHSLVWTGFTCLCQTQKHSTSLSSHPAEQGCHIMVFLLRFYSLKINIAFLYSPDGGADTPSWLLKQNPSFLVPVQLSVQIIPLWLQRRKHWDLIMVCNSNYFCMGRHHPHWPLMHIQSFCCLRGIETVSGQTRASQVTSTRRVSGYEDINSCSCSMNLGSFRSSLQKISWQFLNLNFVYMVCLFLGWW